MTKKESINRSIGLSFDFLKEINNNPSLLSKIPKGATIEFVVKIFQKRKAKQLKEENVNM